MNSTYSTLSQTLFWVVVSLAVKKEIPQFVRGSKLVAWFDFKMTKKFYKWTALSDDPTICHLVNHWNALDTTPIFLIRLRLFSCFVPPVPTSSLKRRRKAETSCLAEVDEEIDSLCRLALDLPCNINRRILVIMLETSSSREHPSLLSFCLPPAPGHDGKQTTLTVTKHEPKT